jgi:hypothetical protein
VALDVVADCHAVDGRDPMLCRSAGSTARAR